MSWLSHPTRRGALAGAMGLGVPGLARAATEASPNSALAEKLQGAVDRAMRATGQPGAAVAVVRDNDILLAQGWGVRKLGAPDPVEVNTLFSIASVSKSFTAASLALLVDEGALGWEDPVRRHLPEFALADPQVSEAITVRDLLLHNSGLDLGAGDLMVWPYTLHTRAQIVAGLRHLPLTRPFRSGFAYDNVLYIAAGEVVAAVRGQPLEQIIAERLFAPAGFKDAVALPSRAVTGNFAWPHARFGGAVRGEGAIQPLARAQQAPDSDVASGGLSLSVRDIARWMQIQLGGGALPEGGRLWSFEQGQAMWRPGTIIRVQDGPSAERPDRPNFDTYALGWQVSDYRGRRMVWHGGYTPGTLSMVALLPSLKAGVAIFANAEEGAFGRAVRNEILDALIGVADVDWLAESLLRRPPRAPSTGVTIDRTSVAAAYPLAAYVGRYRDPWYGEVHIREAGGGLEIDFTMTPGMAGPLEHWGGETFRSRFPDPNLEDAFVTFALAEGGAGEISMQAASPSADFSYDYHHLKLVRGVAGLD